MPRPANATLFIVSTFLTLRKEPSPRALCWLNIEVERKQTRQKPCCLGGVGARLNASFPG